MPSAVLTPFTRSPVRVSGEQLRKRLLPVGEIAYNGGTLRFPQTYLEQIAQAFRGRAYDYVPFQLAAADNKHTNDVERFGGLITGMDVDMTGPDGPGLYITLNPTQRGQAVLSSNPVLGVSARIVEDYARSDGQFYPAAIQHVLGTHDPRIPGLGPWRTVEAANDGTPTIDLSNLDFAADEEDGMTQLTQAQQERLNALLALPEDQWQQVLSGTAAPLTPAEITALNGGDGEDEELAAWVDSLTDEQLAELEAEFSDDGSTQVPVPAGAGLSVEAQMALELANAQSSQALAQLGQINADLDEQRWVAERRRFYDLGVPAPVLTHAEPLLKGAGHVVELAGGQAVDAGAVMRNTLTEYANMARLLDLTGEQGSPLDEPEQHQQAAQDRADLVARAKSQMLGIT